MEALTHSTNLNQQPKKITPPFLRRIGDDFLCAGNPLEKWRIGTLPTEEALAYYRSEKHHSTPSEICTIPSRSGALARAVHKANVCECTFLPYALRGGWLSAFTPPFCSLGQGEAQSFTCFRQGRKAPQENGQRPQKNSQGKAWLIPLKREAPQKRKPQALQPAQDRPEARNGAKPPTSLPQRLSRPMQEPCRSEAQADSDATLSPTGDAPGDYPPWNAPPMLDRLLTVNRLLIKG
ncbi:MAG: hypothetical protein HEP71_30455 [Roseivirga sp.]|nr:hypothetical protein [Roseivirga sp.]